MKAITADNYLINPFVTHKTQTYNHTFLGNNNPSEVMVDVATVPPSSGWIWDDTALKNGSGLYQNTLYVSTRNLFDKFFATQVKRTATSSSLDFEPFFEHSFFGSNYFSNYFGSSVVTSGASSDMYILSLAQQSYGETIRPGSFSITDVDETETLYDDGRGNIISTSDPTFAVGAILYAQGIAVVGKWSNSVVVSNLGLHLSHGDQITVKYDATQTIYEHQIICTMDIGEFNFSTNPSMGFTSSLSPEKPITYHASGTMPSYMTTVGIYNDRGELLVIGKLPNPVKRAANSQQSFIIRFDV